MRILYIFYWAFAWCLMVFSNALALRVLTGSKAENPYFCLWENITGEHTRITFLRHAVDGSYSLLLYTSLWSLETRQLLKCDIENNPEASGKYLSACAEYVESRVELSFNVSLLLNPDSPCEWSPIAGSNYPVLRDRSQHRSNVEIRSRQKRSWVFPGTLWCGRGSKASGYDQLGMFERADHCCREHDHCRHTIHSFTVNYGVFNTHFYTVSHCECDHSFRECLASVNDTISNMVGYSFFNILQVPCFELTPRRRCVKLNWWGKCKVAKVAPYAVFKKPSPFNVTQISEQQAASRKPTVTEGVTSSPNRKFLKRPKPKGSSGRCVLTDSPRGVSFRPRRKKWKKCERNPKPPPTGSSVLQIHLTQTSKPSTQTRGDAITLTTWGAASTTHTKTDVTKRARKGQKNKLPRTESKAHLLLKSTRHSNTTTTTTSARPLIKSTRQSTTTTTSAHPLIKSTRHSTTTTTTSARPLIKSTRQSTTNTTTSAHPLLKSTQQSTTTTISARPLIKSTRQSTTNTTTSAHPLLKSTQQSTTTTISAHPLIKSTRHSTTTTTTSARPLIKSTRQSTTNTTTSAHPLLKSTQQSTTTTTTAVSNTKIPKRTKGFRKHHRCGPRSPPRGDSFQPRRKACSETPDQLPTDQPSTTTTTSPSTKSRAAQTVTHSLNTTSSTPRRTSLLPWRKNATEIVPSSKTWTKPQIKMTSYPVRFGEPLRMTNLSTISSTEESVKPDRVRVS